MRFLKKTDYFPIIVLIVLIIIIIIISYFISNNEPLVATLNEPFMVALEGIDDVKGAIPLLYATNKGKTVFNDYLRAGRDALEGEGSKFEQQLAERIQMSSDRWNNATNMNLAAVRGGVGTTGTTRVLGANFPGFVSAEHFDGTVQKLWSDNDFRIDFYMADNRDLLSGDIETIRTSRNKIGGDDFTIAFTDNTGAIRPTRFMPSLEGKYLENTFEKVNAPFTGFDERFYNAGDIIHVKNGPNNEDNIIHITKRDHMGKYFSEPIGYHKDLDLRGVTKYDGWGGKYNPGSNYNSIVYAGIDGNAFSDASEIRTPIMNAMRTRPKFSSIVMENSGVLKSHLEIMVKDGTKFDKEMSILSTELEQYSDLDNIINDDVNPWSELSGQRATSDNPIINSNDWAGTSHNMKWREIFVSDKLRMRIYYNGDKVGEGETYLITARPSFGEFYPDKVYRLPSNKALDATRGRFGFSGGKIATPESYSSEIANNLNKRSNLEELMNNYRDRTGDYDMNELKYIFKRVEFKYESDFEYVGEETDPSAFTSLNTPLGENLKLNIKTDIRENFGTTDEISFSKYNEEMTDEKKLDIINDLIIDRRALYYGKEEASTLDKLKDLTLGGQRNGRTDAIFDPIVGTDILEGMEFRSVKIVKDGKQYKIGYLVKFDDRYIGMSHVHGDFFINPEFKSIAEIDGNGLYLDQEVTTVTDDGLGDLSGVGDDDDLGEFSGFGESDYDDPNIPILFETPVNFGGLKIKGFDQVGSTNQKVYKYFADLRIERLNQGLPVGQFPSDEEMLNLLKNDVRIRTELGINRLDNKRFYFPGIQMQDFGKSTIINLADNTTDALDYLAMPKFQQPGFNYDSYSPYVTKIVDEAKISRPYNLPKDKSWL